MGQSKWFNWEKNKTKLERHPLNMNKYLKIGGKKLVPFSRNFNVTNKPKNKL
jgi:hypothetical protein